MNWENVAENSRFGKSSWPPAYFDRFGKVHDYLEGVVERARVDGWTETILGRRRYLPDLTSDNRRLREMAERVVLNAQIGRAHV